MTGAEGAAKGRSEPSEAQPTAGMAFNKKGTYSYLQDNVNYVVIDPNLTIRIERINNNIARVYVVDANNVQQPIPQHITMMDHANVHVNPFQNNFLITWVDSYTLLVNGQAFMKLSNQKQQSISAPADAASGVI